MTHALVISLTGVRLSYESDVTNLMTDENKISQS